MARPKAPELRPRSIHPKAIHSSDRTSGGGGGQSYRFESTAASGIGGSGLSNYVARFSDPEYLTAGQLFDNGTNIGLGITSGFFGKVHLKTTADTEPLLRLEMTHASPVYSPLSVHSVGGMAALITSTNTTGTYAVSISSSGSTGRGLHVDTADALALNVRAGASGVTLRAEQTSSGTACELRPTTGLGLDILRNNASGATAVATIVQDHASDTSHALTVRCDGDGAGVSITPGTGEGVRVVRNVDTTGAALVSATQQHVDSIGTTVGRFVQSGDGIAVLASSTNSDATNPTIHSIHHGPAEGVLVETFGAGIGVRIVPSAVGLQIDVAGTSTGAYIRRNLSTTATPLLDMHQDHATCADTIVAQMVQDGLATTLLATSNSADATDATIYAQHIGHAEAVLAQANNGGNALRATANDGVGVMATSSSGNAVDGHSANATGIYGSTNFGIAGRFRLEDTGDPAVNELTATFCDYGTSGELARLTDETNSRHPLRVTVTRIEHAVPIANTITDTAGAITYNDRVQVIEITDFAAGAGLNKTLPPSANYPNGALLVVHVPATATVPGGQSTNLLPNGADTIDGGAGAIVFNAAGQKAILYLNGTDWRRIV